MDLTLIIPSFIAGVLTFLAPCTLPLVPGYLGFISGVSLKDLNDPGKVAHVRGKVFLNGLFYVIGFSLVFIVLGSLFGLGGAALVKYRLWLSRIGGLFVIFFGLFMMDILKLPIFNFLYVERKPQIHSVLKPGNPLSSFIFGSTFAFGWTPCVGPVLGTILVLASTSATVSSGVFLLSVFSLGLAIPFLVVAAFVGSASQYLTKINRYLHVVSFVGGVFLVFLGILLLTNNMSLWIARSYQLFQFIDYDRLLDYL